MKAGIDVYATKAAAYRRDPVLFGREVLGFCPDEWQARVLRDLAEHPRVSVRSGQGVGKTCVQAVALLWFLACFPMARVVATAPTQQQLQHILWAEVAKLMGSSNILSRILVLKKTRVMMKGMEDRWFAVAKTATRAENIQGFHGDNMLFIVDEASGVEDDILQAVLGTLTGNNNKLLLCANPTRLSGVFYDSHNRDAALYRTHRVSARDSKRAGVDNIRMLESKYGSDSNVVRIRVDGEFPLEQDDVFLPRGLVQEAMSRRIVGGTTNECHIACDVARFGNDKTVIGYRIDNEIRFYKKICGQDTQQTADDILELGRKLLHMHDFDRIYIKIDDGGVGGGVVDRLRRLKRNDPEGCAWMDVLPVQFGSAIRHRHFHDSTSFMMGRLREMLAAGLCLPDDPALLAQLCERRYALTDRGKILVENKKAMKARGLGSPDEADCVLLLCLPVRHKNGG